MTVDKYLKLKRIYARVHHLHLSFPYLITESEAKALNYDELSIAQKEEEYGLLKYIHVRV